MNQQKRYQNSPRIPYKIHLKEVSWQNSEWHNMSSNFDEQKAKRLLIVLFYNSRVLSVTKKLYALQLLSWLCDIYSIATYDCTVNKLSYYFSLSLSLLKSIRVTEYTSLFYMLVDLSYSTLVLIVNAKMKN